MRSITRAVILNTTPYSETSLVVKAYTEQSGLVSYMVSGVRTGKSKFHGNLFQPLTLLELVATGKPGQTMQRITDVQLSPPFTSITSDIAKSSMALFLSEVMYRSIREEESNKPLFNFIDNSIQILDLATHNFSRFHLYFMVQLTRYAGFYPHGIFIEDKSVFDLREGQFTSHTPLHPEHTDTQVASLLWKLMNSTFESYQDILIPAATSRVLLSALIRYYELHLTHGKNIVSHKILEEVLG